ncbi:carbohydrate ABC transporter permease [Halalkalibacter flavus]|uniref:carbohydrate ABC transporter permease n=1 Tax=Halalkalibacter flavus TaxID=3090668 RepID=UPI002FC5A4B0
MVNKGVVSKDKTKLLLLPGIIVVVVTTQIPFLMTIIYSFLNYNLIRPDLGVSFAGLKNFSRILTDSEFYSVIVNTFYLTGVSLLLCTIVGIAVALLLDGEIPGINFVRTLILAPFFVMTTVTGMIWKTLILDGTFGWSGHISNVLGVNLPDFFSQYPLTSIMLLIVWQWAPFFVLVILAGLQNIPEEIIESSKIDGASWFSTVVKIKIPMLTMHIQVAVMLGLIFIIKEFGLIHTTTAGGPGVLSNNLTYYVFKVVSLGSDVGRGAAIAVVTVILSVTVITLLFNAIQKQKDGQKL